MKGTHQVLSCSSATGACRSQAGPCFSKTFWCLKLNLLRMPFHLKGHQLRALHLSPTNCLNATEALHFLPAGCLVATGAGLLVGRVAEVLIGAAAGPEALCPFSAEGACTGSKHHLRETSHGQCPVSPGHQLAGREHKSMRPLQPLDEATVGQAHSARPDLARSALDSRPGLSGIVCNRVRS